MINWEIASYDEISYERSTFGIVTHRAKVPGGWFVYVSVNQGSSVFFYPDPRHEWDGSSLDFSK